MNVVLLTKLCIKIQLYSGKRTFFTHQVRRYLTKNIQYQHYPPFLINNSIPNSFGEKLVQ